MNNMISMGEGGSINPDRVILIASLSSAPVKRFIKQTDKDKVINLTYGYPQRSILVFDTGIIAITRYCVEDLAFAVRSGKEVETHDLPF